VIQISLNETVVEQDLADVVAALAEGAPSGTKARIEPAGTRNALPPAARRTSPFMTHPVFSSHHSETELMRYIRALEHKDIGLDTSMIPLGSCTMKLNAAAEMMPVTWPEFSRMHPFVPAEQAQGYRQIFDELESALGTITGFPAVSLQPNSGAQGEFAGPARHSGLPRVTRRQGTRHRAHPAVGARHEPGQRRHGRHVRRHRRVRRPRKHRGG
jgi:glycine dehydrogenase